MKKVLMVAIMLCFLIALQGCSSAPSNAEGQGENATQTEQVPSQNVEKNDAPITIKESPDKYTAYIKNYVGRNCATIGYESLGGDRNDRIGNGYIQLVMLSENGEYIGVEDEVLKEYVVVAQNLSPNTEVKFTFQKSGEGEEFDNLIEWQSVKDIVLKVKKAGSNEEISEKGMTSILVSDDKYTAYVKDYVGRNLANCGYISLGGDLRDAYGATNIKLSVVSDDGAFIEIEEETLKNYCVTDQNPSPNTKISFEYDKDSDGNEYSWTTWQSIQEIELYVTALK